MVAIPWLPACISVLINYFLTSHPASRWILSAPRHKDLCSTEFWNVFYSFTTASSFYPFFFMLVMLPNVINHWLASLSLTDLPALLLPMQTIPWILFPLFKRPSMVSVFLDWTHRLTFPIHQPFAYSFHVHPPRLHYISNLCKALFKGKGVSVNKIKYFPYRL